MHVHLIVGQYEMKSTEVLNPRRCSSCFYVLAITQAQNIAGVVLSGAYYI